MSKTNLGSPTSNFRNRNLDMIKLISCIAVVVLHCLYTPEFESSRFLYQLCAYAVPCFFMASGWLLLNKQSVGWGYVFKKLLGIARVVVIWNVIIYGLQLAKLMWHQGISQVNYLSYLRTYGPYVIKSVLQRGQLWQFWYLGATGAMYCLLPFLHRFICSKGCLKDCPRRGWMLWGVFLGISVAIQTLNMIKGHPVQEPLSQTFRVWTTMQYFLLGGLMPLAVKWFKDNLPLKLHLILASLLTILTLVWRLIADRFFIHGVLVEYYYDDLPTIIWIVAGFTALMRVELKPGVQRVIDRVSPLIMGVYILHVPIRNLIRVNFEIEGSFWRIVYAMAVLLISALGVYLLRKLPFGKKMTEI